MSDHLQPSLVVLHAIVAERVQPAVEQLHALARRHRVALGGAAARVAGSDADVALVLGGGVVAEAAFVTQLVPSGVA